MNSATSLTRSTEVPSWSASAMLFFGMLSSQGSADKRLRLRVAPAWVLLMLWCTWVGWPGHSHAAGWQRAIASVLPGAIFLFFVTQWWRYLQKLDELERKIHYEALAWTYLGGLVAWGFLFGWGAAQGWQVGVLWQCWFILLEPVRGCILYVLARRYQ